MVAKLFRSPVTGVLLIALILLFTRELYKSNDESNKNGYSQGGNRVTINSVGQQTNAIHSTSAENNDGSTIESQRKKIKTALSDVKLDDHDNNDPSIQARSYVNPSPANAQDKFIYIEYISSLIDQYHNTVDSSTKYSLLQLIWIRVADVDSIDLLNKTIDFFENVAKYDGDGHIVDLANKAVADLTKLKYANSTTDSEISENPGVQLAQQQSMPALQKDYRADFNAKISSPDNAAKSNSKNEQNDANLIQFSSIVEQALSAPTELERHEAILNLSRYRTDDAIKALNQAANDSNDKNRFTAVQTLWYSYADNIDHVNQDVIATMQGFTNDPNQRIATLATKAVKDLQALKSKRAQEKYVQQSETASYVPKYDSNDPSLEATQ